MIQVTTFIVCSTLVAGALWAFRLYDSDFKIAEITPLSAKIDQLTSHAAKYHDDAPVRFSDKTFIKGILHKHTQKKDQITSFEDTLGAGVCSADFNNDGWEDLYFVVGSGNLRHFGANIWWQDPKPNQLYLNQQGQFFSNSTTLFGSSEATFGIACAVADLDNDGFVDIVTANKGENVIYRNIEGKRFEKADNSFDKNDSYFSTSILIDDFNNDGRFDILFGNYVTFKQEQNTLELNAGYDTQKNINFDASIYDAQPDTLYLNKGEFKFELSDTYTAANKHGRTLAFYSDSSIVALNDKGSPSQLIKQGENESFLKNIVLSARDAKSLFTPSTPSSKILVASDAQKGGLFALSTTDPTNETSWDFGINDTQRLYHTWAIVKADFNMDGFEDLFLSNGLAAPHPDSQQTAVGQPNTVLIARPNQHKFIADTIKQERMLSSRGAAVLDINNDGKQDLIISNNNDFPSLLVNETVIPNNWIGIKCVPAHICRSVKLRLNKISYDQPFNPQTSYASQSTSALLAILNDQASDVELTLTSDKGTLTKRLPRSPTYYMVNLMQNSIEPITPPETSQTITPSNTMELREELIALIRKDQTTPRTTELISRIVEVADSDKIIILDEVINSKSKVGIPLAEYWARSSTPAIAIKAIDALRVAESEEAIPRLIDLLNSPNSAISCAAAKAFEFFYWKDEAVIERKGWAKPELVKLMSGDNQDKALCAVDALAESENFRALRPLLQALESPNSYLVARAARALGMLRQTEALDKITDLLSTSHHPIVRAEALVALVRLNIDVSKINKDRYLKTGGSLFNWLLLSSLKKSNDGVNTDTLNPILMTDLKSIPPYFSLFSYSFLFELANINPETANQKLEAFSILYKNTKTMEAFELNQPITSLRQLDEIMIKATVTESGKGTTTTECTNTIVDSNANTNANRPAKAPRSNRPQNSSTIADVLRSCLNGGHYAQAALLATDFSNEEAYWFSFAQLMGDKRLQTSEAIYAIEHFPLPLKGLNATEQRIAMLSASEKLELLRVLERKAPRNEFKDWLIETRPTMKEPALEHFINGRL